MGRDRYDRYDRYDRSERSDRRRRSPRRSPDRRSPDRRSPPRSPRRKDSRRDAKYYGNKDDDRRRRSRTPPSSRRRKDESPERYKRRDDRDYERRNQKRRRDSSSSDRSYRNYKRPARRDPPSKKKESTRFRFDSPPKEEDKKATILAAAAQIGATATSLEEAQSWLQCISPMDLAQHAQVDRKLYVGNLPPETDQKELHSAISEAMEKINRELELDLAPGKIVVSTWISSEGAFGFIEFRSPEEASHGFHLQGFNFKGHELRVTRPKAYQDAEIERRLNQGAEDGAPPIEQSTVSQLLIGNSEPTPLFKIFQPSRVLKLDNVVTFENSCRFQSCREVYTDVWKLCSQFAEIEQLKIPRPIWVPGRPEENALLDKEKEEEEEKELGRLQKKMKDLKKKKKNDKQDPVDDQRNFDLPPHFGSVFVKFVTIEEAKAVKQAMLSYGEMQREKEAKKGKSTHEEGPLRYEDRVVGTSFWGEEEFEIIN